METDVPLEHKGVMAMEKEPTMFVGGPIYGSDDKTVIAAIALRIAPAEFTQIARLSRFGDSGETYAFNSNGRLITESRFDQTLRDTQLIQPGERGILCLVLRDPGADLTRGSLPTLPQERQPFTRMVERILSERLPMEKPVIMVDVHRDYRGVSVVGAGFWNDERGFGLTTMVDAEEAYHTYRIIFWVVLTVFGFTVAIFTALSLKLDRLRDFALDANPLTGLPGNRIIAERVNEAIAKDYPVSVVYCDLDNFKAYNDKYSFSKGDDILRFTGQTLLRAIEEKSGRGSFVGHIGGDDFVYIVPSIHARTVGDEIARRFERGIPQHYTPEDVARGCIESKDRQGRTQTFPLMTISMAGVDMSRHSFTRFLEVATLCAEAKKKAKSIPGNSLFIDRRQS